MPTVQAFRAWRPSARSQAQTACASPPKRTSPTGLFTATPFCPLSSSDFTFHLIGCVLVALFVQFRWELKSYGWIFALFSCLPLVVEVSAPAEAPALLHPILADGVRVQPGGPRRAEHCCKRWLGRACGVGLAHCCSRLRVADRFHTRSRFSAPVPWLSQMAVAALVLQFRIVEYV